MKKRVPLRSIMIVQTLFVVGLIVAWVALPGHSQRRVLADLTRKAASSDVALENVQPAIVRPLQIDAEQVTDADLRLVLNSVLPRFDRIKLRPNYVEHALRIWGSEITFDDDEQLISGPEMVDFLLDSSRYVNSWGPGCQPILLDNEIGVGVRWGQDRTASVHHDHLLACLAEAGVGLDRDVFTPSRRTTVQSMLDESLSNFRLNERET